MIKQTIIVTGGSSGMGKAMAKRFAEEGHNVVITGRSQEKLDITKEELSALNNGSLYQWGSHHDGWWPVAESAPILINNAFVPG